MLWRAKMADPYDITAYKVQGFVNYDTNSITCEILTKSLAREQVIATRIVDLQDKFVRDALVRMGWTPPGTAAPTGPASASGSTSPGTGGVVEELEDDVPAYAVLKKLEFMNKRGLVAASDAGMLAPLPLVIKTIRRLMRKKRK